MPEMHKVLIMRDYPFKQCSNYGDISDTSDEGQPTWGVKTHSSLSLYRDPSPPYVGASVTKCNSNETNVAQKKKYYQQRCKNLIEPK